MLTEEEPYAEALGCGWATLIRDDFQNAPLINEKWKTYKIDLQSPIDVIPQLEGPALPAVLGRTAYITYDPERWVWAGAQTTETCVYSAAGQSYHLAARV